LSSIIKIRGLLMAITAIRERTHNCGTTGIESV
jgi:hypothetical protein